MPVSEVNSLLPAVSDGCHGDQAFLEEVMEEGWVLDGTIAQDSMQTAAIWGLREGISVALKHAGATPPCCVTHRCDSYSEELPCHTTLTHPMMLWEGGKGDNDTE